MKNLLAVGDSHSSLLFGQHSWPDVVASSLDFNLIRTASPGAGNSFFIEKIHYALRNYKIDLVIVQLTNPTRVVTGFRTLENAPIPDLLNHGGRIDNLACYTWNLTNNENNLKSMTGKNTIIDHVWVPEIGLSKWIDYKVMQDIATMQYICSSFQVKCIFWSWFVPFEDLFLPEYNWLKEKINWIPGCANNYLEEHEIPFISNENKHYNGTGHSKLVNGWLLPRLTDRIKL